MEILGDVHDEEEAIDEDDEMKKKREDSSTTNWFKCGDTSRWRPMDFPLVVSVLVRHKEDAVYRDCAEEGNYKRMRSFRNIK